MRMRVPDLVGDSDNGMACEPLDFPNPRHGVMMQHCSF